MTEFQKALNTITDEIAFICTNFDSFKERFAKKGSIEVYGISFDGIHIKYNVVEKSGMHSINERTISEYLRWKDSF